MDAALVERIRRGEYVIDEHAVAEAVLRRWRRAPSAVLVPAQPLDRAAVGSDQDEPAPGDHLP
jgi:hypothetical protein